MSAEQIVLALAASDSPTHGDPGYATYCLLCAANNCANPQQTLADPRDHEADCPWRRAREYAAAVGGEPDYSGERLPFTLPHNCDGELRARADYDIFRGTPATFDCSCGQRWAYVDDEAEGAWWERVTN